MSRAGAVGPAERRGTGSPAAEMLPRCCSRGLGNLGLCPQSGYSPCPLQTEERAASAFVPGRAAPAGAPGTGKAICLLGALPGAGSGGMWAGAEGQLRGDPAGDLVL